ncbi:HIT family protein [bacterium]|nr:HIT family protein [bacterium]
MTIFEKIIAGEIPAYKIAEDSNYLAFLDINPVKKGHALAIPKKATDYIFDLDDDVLAGLNVFAKKVAKGIEKVVPCKRIGVAVVGLEVPHTHIHLIPIDSVADLSFANPKVKMSQEELEDLAAQIKAAI